MIIIRFIKEWYRWVKYGHKYRSQKNMKQIYTVCQICPHFVKAGGWLPGYDKCDICGCNLHRSKRAVNKIAWKTTSCPDMPPRWLAEINSDGADADWEPPY